MTKLKYGIALSSEEFGPRELVSNGVIAEKTGFDFVMVSDHFHPWIDKQGESPFVWNVIGGLAEKTNKINIGTGVSAPIIRIHPVNIAQAAATSQVQSEGRFRLGIGTGENLNEHVVGYGWPEYKIRSQMLSEAVDIFRKLWKGGYQSYYGEYFTVEDARIYTLPDSPPPIIYSAFGPKSAADAGRLADGFITTSPNKKLVNKFKDNHKKKNAPIYGQMSLVYGKDKKEALKYLKKMWPLAGIPSPLNTELRLPSYFEETAKMIDTSDISSKYFVGDDTDEFIKKVNKYKQAGFTHLYLHHIGKNQKDFMEWFMNSVHNKL